MNSDPITRKDFIRSSALTVAGLTMGPTLLAADRIHNDNTVMNTKKLKLKNVRLETGFEYEGDTIIATKTALFALEIENGRFTKISAQQEDIADAIDAKGMLLLPSFKDMHIHLDKTYYGERWQATRRTGGGVKGMIALEQQILPSLLEKSTYKAEKLIELLQSKGTSFARSHVNIEPTSKLDSLKNLEQALQNKKNGFGAELVAFPQHGVFYTDTAPYLREAAKMDIDFIGGVDPYSIDGAIEKTMDFTVQLALDHNKGIDIHLHESGESGLKTVEYLIQKVEENPVLKGKTYLSHAFVLGRIDSTKQEELAEKLAHSKVGIVSTVPFGGLTMPIPALLKHGVNVLLGNDSIVDHWNTFGSGSVLQKANLAAQLYGYTSEFALSRTLKLATAGIVPLDDKGTKQWPNVGQEADAILVNATCSAEAVSRIADIKSLIYKGNIVY
ncbi:amidohydrolase [Sphingobacterium faecale]|uniref:Amidohydrolase family protein n=1 Tax=Sphingobacterium faecale TaxID=2803775 RepID=A0ABS1R2J9_9SPHI|nr:amidohydrolase [Sphingobacterium faecale]MBL1408908.1 amidohydrolase family protein [Sphingobacterium faecale]